MKEGERSLAFLKVNQPLLLPLTLLWTICRKWMLLRFNYSRNVWFSFQCMLEKVGNWNFDIFLFDRLTNGKWSTWHTRVLWSLASYVEALVCSVLAVLHLGCEPSASILSLLLIFQKDNRNHFTIFVFTISLDSNQKLLPSRPDHLAVATAIFNNSAWISLQSSFPLFRFFSGWLFTVASSDSFPCRVIAKSCSTVGLSYLLQRMSLFPQPPPGTASPCWRISPDSVDSQEGFGEIHSTGHSNVPHPA